MRKPPQCQIEGNYPAVIHNRTGHKSFSNITKSESKLSIKQGNRSHWGDDQLTILIVFLDLGTEQRMCALYSAMFLNVRMTKTFSTLTVVEQGELRHVMND